METTKTLTRKDFASDQAVRWCPGCGDYAILASVQNVLAKIGQKKEKLVFVSGIGCSSRFPYYIDSYGFHGIHGRAPAVATGVKVANPDLDVWVISGDGDSMAIGGNHFIHVIRRNVDLNYIIFNNEIYGLTKGQYSPTSKTGCISKTSPYGSLEHNFTPASLAIGAEATFFARVVDNVPKEMQEVFLAAVQHKGTSVVEVLQNCVIFSDGVHDQITDKSFRDEHQLHLEHGKPMIYGAQRDKGIALDRFGLKTVILGENGVTEKDVLVHDIYNSNPGLAFMLSRMRLPEFPVPVGIFRQVKAPTYDQQVQEQIKEVTAKKGGCADLQKFLNTGDVWEVK